MAKILTFRLSGSAAFFKRPSVNKYRYLSYHAVHKIALLGIFGAITGLGGYLRQDDKEFPEFYERLRDLKCSIEIVDPKTIKKKFVRFNNSLGYANDGQTLIVEEEWLENPSWVIRVLIDSIPEDVPLVEYLQKKKSVYVPYLGKNDHPAIIEDIEIVDGELFTPGNASFQCHGLLPEEGIDVFPEYGVEYHMFKDSLPVRLSEGFNLYETDNFMQTTGSLQLADQEIVKSEFYKINDAIYCFV